MSTTKKAKFMDCMAEFSNIEVNIIEQIEAIQNDIEDIDEKACKEIQIIDYNSRIQRIPFYNKRMPLLEQLPSFWTKTLLNHPRINCMITDSDAKLLEYLFNINIVFLHDEKMSDESTQEEKEYLINYRVELIFRDNPYIQTKLWKQITMDKTKGIVKTYCEIEWKDQKYADSRNTTNTIQGFLDWFIEKKNTGIEDYNSDDVVEVIYQDIWPDPLQYYLSEELEANVISTEVEVKAPKVVKEIPVEPIKA
ncbi:hypothetical protein A3Q56_01379 [Intoshia linei]|uniref:Nucleosome assembly protein n=1 Tax=Intoshia linei TaxID=1819745 RepID=A0A177BB55_9BILA|nr:hypothetical protein A3Q56_01379 [Intoshia linei]